MKPLVLTLFALVLAFAALAATSGDVRSGVWTADLIDGRVEMNAYTGNRDHDSRHWNNNMGFSLPASRFEGAIPNDGDSKFALRAPAGTIAFDGHWSGGKGAGHFTFTPNDSFVREMDSLGYTDFRDGQMLMFATTDFDPTTIRGLKAMGYDITRRDLDEVAVFHITPDVIRGYARDGYPNLTMREVVNFRIGHVTSAFINGFRRLGYTDIPARDLGEMAILHLTPEYAESLRNAGYDHIPPRQLVEMKIFKIDPEYIKEMKAIGISDVKKMIEMKATGAADILAKHKTR